MEPLRAVKGMNDLFEADLVTWRHVERIAKETFLAYGFGEIRTPIVEETQLFVRGVGEGTDIVGKEMFTFPERDGPKSLCLRPENTAGVVRAMVENGKVMADAFSKVFYLGPQFRNERPQAGRYRQFHQLGAEVLGYSEPAADVEVMALIHTLLVRLGIKDAKLHLNTLGDTADRPRYREALVAHFEPHAASLSEDSRDRLHKNPLRILDSKDPRDKALKESAPKPRAFLSDDARAHFDAVQAGLTALEIPFVLDDELVRGLDYYTRTVFEFIGEAGLGAQSTLAAGGRYDNLVEELGGRATPAVGFAAGIERLILSLRAQSDAVPAVTPALALIGADDTGRAKAQALAFSLRARGLVVDVDLRGRSVKAQMRHADRSGARFTLVLGSREIAEGRAELKPMGGGDVSAIALEPDALAQALR
jgi:histidyl-tRNA synthetase